jgi:hypothetical protein
VLAPKRQYGGLPREKLVRAVEYIQDQLSTDLTVFGIAQAVGSLCSFQIGFSRYVPIWNVKLADQK